MIDKDFHDVVSDSVCSLGFDFWGMQWIQERNQKILRVYIDSEKGIHVDDCAQVSHQLSAVLDVEEPIKSEYLLEVSSPGVERPLFMIEHFFQYVDAEIVLFLHHAVNGRKKWQGVIESVDVDLGEIMLNINEEMVAINFANILKANVVFNFKDER